VQDVWKGSDASAFEMSESNPRILLLAKRLVAYEAGRHPSGVTDTQLAWGPLEKLRPYLSNLMGHAGFSTLLARAVALSNSEFPWLNSAAITPKGTMSDFPEGAGELNPEALRDACTAVLANMLGLLVTLVGEHLTLRLLDEIWPAVIRKDLEYGKGD